MGLSILQICKKVPFPPKDGESIAISAITKGMLAHGHSVTMFALNTRKHNVEVANLTINLGDNFQLIAIDIDTSVKILPALRNLFNAESYNIERFSSEVVKQRLRELLQSSKFDIIHLEGLYLTPYVPIIRKLSSAIIGMRSHNVEHEIWERMVAQTTHPVKKMYMRFLAKRLKSYEIGHLNSYDKLIPISSRDGKRFNELGATIPIGALPTGIDVDDYIPSTNNNPLSAIVFFGALDWLPNQEGLKWFLREVWPLVQDKTTVSLVIAGRNAPEWMVDLGKKERIIFKGEVSDATEIYNNYQLIIAPLLSGSGIRIKLIESLAFEKLVVATTIAAEGLGCTNGKELLLADDPISFGNAIVKLLKDIDLQHQLKRNGREHIAKNFDNRQLTKQLLDFYQTTAT